MAVSSSSSSFESPVIAHIPVDLFISRNRQGLTRGDLTFTDPCGNLVYSVDDPSSKSSAPSSRVLLDSRGIPLISISRDNGEWIGITGDGRERRELMFRTERTVQSRRRKEVDVFLISEDSGGSVCSFKIRGCPLQRSCTIYQGNSVVAQTSLLYKLGKVLVGRRRFRLTIFPGFVDHTLVVALVLVFFGERI